MHKFQVFESSRKGAAIALIDGQGQCHIARTLGSAPPVGAELDGPRGLGPVRLRCTTTGRMFQVAFVQQNLDRQTSIERLHPRLTV
jgi:hypothetical protein